jgi:hypothetical protein
MLFKKLADLAGRETDTLRLTAILQALKELRKISDASLPAAFASRIIAGDLAHFAGLPFFAADPDSMALHFLTAYLKSSSDRSVASGLLASLPSISASGVPSVLEPLVVAIDRGLIDAADAPDAATALIELVPGLPLEADDAADAVAAVCQVLCALVRKFNLDPSIALAAVCDARADVEATPQASGALLHCALELRIAQQPCDGPALVSLLAELPLKPEYRPDAGVVECALTIAEMAEVGAEAREAALRILIGFALAPGPALEASGIGEDARSRICGTLRVAVGKDPSLERRLTRTLSRQAQNRFGALVKQ